MKTKRELLRHFVKYGDCEGIRCIDCPYDENIKHCLNSDFIKKIGAMAILRMFREKKKPLLSAGTKIKFSDGSIATIEIKVHGMGDYEYVLLFNNGEKAIDYLIGRTWEVVE